MLSLCFQPCRAQAKPITRASRNHTIQSGLDILSSFPPLRYVLHEPSICLIIHSFSYTSQHLAQLWDNYLETIQESLSHDLQEYIAKFPEIKNKIAKRGRKLVDYDSARHNLDSLVNSKKPDQAKIFKVSGWVENPEWVHMLNVCIWTGFQAQEDLNEAKRIYEDMNNELHRELPALFERFVSRHSPECISRNDDIWLVFSLYVFFKFQSDQLFICPL